MADLFKEVIPSILQTKKECVTEQNEKDYVPFVVNKALSFHMDCSLYANQMNLQNSLDPLLQYHYMLNKVRGYKRPYQAWHKRETIEDLEAVKEYYHYSNEKAKEALLVLSSDQINEIRKRLYKGGLDDKFGRTNRGKARRTG